MRGRDTRSAEWLRAAGRAIGAAALVMLAHSEPASAAGECRGVFVRNSQALTIGVNRASRPRRGPRARAGAQAIFAGEMSVSGERYYLVGATSLYPAGDVRLLAAGCELMYLDPR